ncbi:hypothetical protein ABBQ38_014761 [Trebouxia sp. C0009 RCD-2024]
MPFQLGKVCSECLELCRELWCHACPSFLLCPHGVGAGRRLLDSGTDGSGEAAPSGSYKETCKNIQFTDDNGGTVIANCGDGAGGYPRSEITNVASCSNGITNDGGVLKC